MLGTVYSSHGEISYNLQTGQVIEIDHTPGQFDNNFNNICKIDVEEYRKFYHQPVPTPLDILSIGYWLKDGTYEGAETDWRLEEDRARRGDTRE